MNEGESGGQRVRERTRRVGWEAVHLKERCVGVSSSCVVGVREKRANKWEAKERRRSPPRGWVRATRWNPNLASTPLCSSTDPPCRPSGSAQTVPPSTNSLEVNLSFFSLPFFSVETQNNILTSALLTTIPPHHSLPPSLRTPLPYPVPSPSLLL